MEGRKAILARNLSVLTEDELIQSVNIIRKVAEAAEKYAAEQKKTNRKEEPLKHEH